MIKYILFDMDGVLVNTEPLHYRVWKQTFEENGFVIDYEHYKGCIGSTKNYLFDLMQERYGIDFHNNDDIVERFAEIKNEIISTDGIPRIEGVPEVIRYLYDKGYRMAVASSSSQSVIEFNMEQLGLTDYFEVLFSGERVKNSKPAPDIFLAVAEKLGARPSECLVVEDSCNGTKAAKAAGMLCYGFNNPDSGNQDLSLADKMFYPFIELKYLL